jgi:Tfp pilus assembly protein PilX
MRVRLLTLVVTGALTLAPMSRLGCELLCIPAHTVKSAAHGSAHEECHAQSDTSSTAMRNVHHHCDHAVAIPRPAERLATKLVKVSGAAASTSTEIDEFSIVLNQGPVSGSPPRYSDSRVTSVPSPLRI